MRKVPKLRFKEFSDEWEEKKLREIIEISNLKYNPTKENKKYPCIELESLTQETGKILNQFNSLEQKSIKNKFNKEEILFGKLRPYLKKYYFTEFEGVCSSEIWVFTSKINIKKFIYYFIQTEKFLTLANTTSGTKMPRADWSLMKDENFLIPSLQEQGKIADFLSGVDKKISLTEEKLELFRDYKKGVMQKIFSQELRFKDSNGNDYPEWEEKRLGELPIIISDGNYGELYPKANELLNEGVPFIRVNNLKNSKIVKNEMKYISKELHNVLLSGHLKFGDILISTRGDIGITAYVEKEYDNANINAQLCLIRVTGNYFNNKFLLYLFQNNSSQKQFNELQTGSALKQLPKKNLIKLKVNIPVLEEQQKISDFLSSIDSKIESIEKELEGLKEFKKGLLQQMFV